MSVIVQGMEEPERCDLCPFYRTYKYLPVVSCKAVNKVIGQVEDPKTAVYLEQESPDWCPIKPLPERKTGRWVIRDDPGIGWYKVVCSECGEDFTSVMPFVGLFPIGRALWDYCPECGSYNGGEK